MGKVGASIRAHVARPLDPIVAKTESPWLKGNACGDMFITLAGSVIFLLAKMLGD